MAGMPIQIMICNCSILFECGQHICGSSKDGLYTSFWDGMWNCWQLAEKPWGLTVPCWLSTGAWSGAQEMEVVEYSGVSPMTGPFKAIQLERHSL